ncbi:MAG: methyl-accepting chemotaxis protein [Desulfuromonadaceae bacterium]|nr:methyl-accepting chemotaxis protein [Desulfuromonadaceae bacterium]MDD2849219.1 methyl-accepting chemotaxis protein [Desulfuromonadaceae bacterium]MDD4129732.1 methyl-accepting chemotaxis protein [Desulfuromonadaceae bacterium]
MTIRATLITFSIANAIILFVIMIGFVVFSKHQGDKLERLVTSDFVFSRAVDQAYNNALRAGIALRTMAIDPEDELAAETFKKARQEFVTKANESRRTNDGKAGELMGKAVALWATSDPIKDRIVKLIMEGKREQAMFDISDDTDILRDIKGVIDQAKKEQDKELAASIKENRESILKGRLAIAGLLLTGIFGIIITVLIAFQRVLRPLERLVSAVAKVGTGDLSQKIQVDNQDELGRLASEFNTMVSKLSSMVVKIADTSGELELASTQISETTQLVVSASEIQVIGVKETSSAVIEITSSIQSVAQSVENLSISASESSASTLEMAANIEAVVLDVEGLDRSVADVSCSINEMAATVKQINGSVQQLSDISVSTSSSIAEMNYSINEVEQNVLKTAAISEELLNDANFGKKSVEATIIGIQEIRKASGLTSEAITSLDAKAGDIGKILLVINDVAEQTNLLALNASIIAAQAGPHGKGFAVVADEIKELAHRTKVSTMEIAHVIKAVQNDTDRATDTIVMAEKSIVNGERLSKESESALQKIVVGIQLSSERMNQIARATGEQAKGSRMISESIEHVSEMVKQIANATSEQSKGSELIRESAEIMKSLTGEVNTSIREQAVVSNFIAKNTEQTTSMIRQIKQATNEQISSSNQIVQSIDAIQTSAHSNATSAKALNDVIANLSQQVRLLQEEMANFRQ